MKTSRIPLLGLGLGLLALVLSLAFSLRPDHSERTTIPPPKTIEIEAVPGLQYDRVRFAVKPGQPVELTLTNASSLSHNLLITEPGTRLRVVKAANQMENGPERDYVPRSDAVLHFTPVLDPGQKDSLSFTAPEEEGIYPYVCTFPGHGLVMYGAMYVSPEGDEALPPLADDAHVPPDSLRTGTAASVSPHPYPMEPPLISRTFMPESSPASIAVGLEGGVSYSFDAVPVMLRYAWSGGFVDNSEVFKGHVANQRASIEGSVFYRNEEDRSLRIGTRESPSKIEFGGYQLVQGRPEFTYTVDGTRVRDHIEPTPDGPGLRRTFRIEEPERPVRFVRHPHPGVVIRASAGEWRSDTLHLRPDEAQEFTITMKDTSGTVPTTSHTSPVESTTRNR